MNSKQHQLTFEEGITNVPSDALCSDNTLADCVGLTYADGEHKVIQKPALHMTINSGFNGLRIVYIHKPVGAVNYIGVTADGKLKAGRNDAGQFAGYSGDLRTGVNIDDLQVSSIGKTLIVNDGGTLSYFLWNYNKETRVWEYKDLGTRIPAPQLWVSLRPYHEANPDIKGREQDDAVRCAGKTGELFAGSDEDITVASKYQEDLNTLVIGMYAKNKKTIANKKCFCNPFFVRVALELYDGTYTNIGNPILVMPSVSNNTWMRLGWSTEGEVFDMENYGVFMYTIARQLMFRQMEDYAKWEDIVKDVVIFASNDVDVYDTTADVPLPNMREGYKYDGYYEETDGGPCIFHRTTVERNYYWMPLTRRNSGDQKHDIRNALKTTSVFYKLCAIGKEAINEWKSTRDYIESHVLENLTTQERLKYDDYYSHCEMTADSMYVYNSRLNLAGLSRGFFKGFTGSFITAHNSQGEPPQANTIKYYVNVYIKTNEGEKVVQQVINSPELIELYFYYPDPRAYKAEIFNGATLLRTLELEEHPGLNGAFFMFIYAGVMTSRTQDFGTPPAVDTPTPEHLPNYVGTSEVNNPYVFKVEGYNKVGNGRVIGMATITQALSQGQFGQYPLLVFTNEGIWAESTGSTGQFTAVHPMSREVALESNPCITQTDGAVFFASKKGLMVIVGSDVRCVSEQLSGKVPVATVPGNRIGGPLTPFPDYLQTAFIAYDYRDSLLWIFNGSAVCYNYSIKSGTFSRYDFGLSPVTNVVNDYPDYLLQSGTQVFSLLHRPDINSDDGSTYSAYMLTRPLKLGDSLALKSIMRMKNIKDMSGTMSVSIEGSDDLNNWRTLMSLRTKPWKYYRFRYNFSGLLATDRFAGTVLITQERRTNKLR